ncbi:MAG: chemotaxis protein CheW [Lachnospiraceae bacterium]
MDELRADFAEAKQYIVIKLGHEQYGIEIKYIDNIVRMQHITRVPKVAPYLKGVINLRGEVLPVMSLRVKMGLEEDEMTKSTRIIILKVEGNETTGVLVDEVREVLTLGPEQIEKVNRNANDEKAGFVSEIGQYNGELISLLDLNACLTDKEN